MAEQVFVARERELSQLQTFLDRALSSQGQVVFEFLFRHYVMGNSWSRLLHEYNLLEGRVWIFAINYP